MKALIFNHHPDYFWYTKTLLESLNIEVEIASEKLTFECGADYSSISSDNKFRTGPKWYEPKDLFPDIELKISNTIDDYDYYCTTNRDIAKKLPFDNNKIIYSTVVSWDIIGCNELNKYKKISSVDYVKNYGGHRITYFVPQRGQLKEKKYITQLIENYKSIYFNELMYAKHYAPTIIAGSEDAPDGVVNDWKILEQTSLLVHHKDYGTCCNAVMKALDTGIPIYMSKKNRYILGFDDIPEDCFIYSEDYSVLEAYEISKSIDNNKIQNQFRNVKNLNNANKDMRLLLNK